jgi:hypothetical protein
VAIRAGKNEFDMNRATIHASHEFLAWHRYKARMNFLRWLENTITLIMKGWQFMGESGTRVVRSFK